MLRTPPGHKTQALSSTKMTATSTAAALDSEIVRNEK